MFHESIYGFVTLERINDFVFSLCFNIKSIKIVLFKKIHSGINEIGCIVFLTHKEACHRFDVFLASILNKYSDYDAVFMLESWRDQDD